MWLDPNMPRAIKSIHTRNVQSEWKMCFIFCLNILHLWSPSPGYLIVKVLPNQNVCTKIYAGCQTSFPDYVQHCRLSKNVTRRNPVNPTSPVKVSSRVSLYQTRNRPPLKIQKLLSDVNAGNLQNNNGRETKGKRKEETEPHKRDELQVNCACFTIFAFYRDAW